MTELKILKLRSIKLASTNRSIISSFFKPKLKELDYSFNEFDESFAIFKLSSDITHLELVNLSINSNDLVYFQHLTKLTKLDLSFNLIDCVLGVNFKNFSLLEYLDLSNNNISILDPRVFDLTTKLKYINLENNKIHSIGNEMLNYMKLEVFKLANNKLINFPVFNVNTPETQPASFEQLYVNNNFLSSIKPFSAWICLLKTINFDNNEISSIETDALSKLDKLEKLSIANNKLNSTRYNYFSRLYSLKYLNLSHNQIETIENGTFTNLNNLLVLDLSWNSIINFEKGVFYGLANLKDLYLNSFVFFRAKEKSFDHLKSVSNIYLNESVLLKLENKCALINSLKREIKKYIGKYIIYLSSINLITANAELNCELSFELILSNIHLNMKSDYKFEEFYHDCYLIIAQVKNKYKNNW